MRQLLGAQQPLLQFALANIDLTPSSRVFAIALAPKQQPNTAVHRHNSIKYNHNERNWFYFDWICRLNSF
jgi:hypothetical protein